HTTYSSDSSTAASIDNLDLETLTTIALNADNTNLDYTDEAGTTIKVDLTAAVKNLETLTTLVANAGDGTFTYTNEAGTPTIIDISDLETVRKSVVEGDSGDLGYPDGVGTKNNDDQTAAVEKVEA